MELAIGLTRYWLMRYAYQHDIDMIMGKLCDSDMMTLASKYECISDTQIMGHQR